MKVKGRVIWIDLDNTPHVYFFRPVIDELQARGFEVLLTARKCAQTCELADLYRLNYKQVGAHFGKNKIFKMIGLLSRAVQLSVTVRSKKPLLALSHGSRASVIASNFLGIRNMMIVDYEFAKAIPFFKHHFIMAPDVIPPESFTGVAERVLGYPGIKEDVYIPFFMPDRSVLSELGLQADKIIATVRPPAFDAHYHNPQSDVMFLSAMERLLGPGDVQTVLLPRNEKQKNWVIEKWREEINAGSVVVPDKAIDGLSMMYFSDLVISGGGTMNREAAAIGVPVYSIFRGTIGSVDKCLAENGRLVLLENESDVQEKIVVQKWDRPERFADGQSKTLTAIVNNIEDIINK